MNANAEQLTSVYEIGPKIAASIVTYFSDGDNLEMIKRLKSTGIRFSNENKTILKGNVLDGKIIVISGVFQKYSRDEYKELIERNGGKNSTSVSRSTTFILAGENMGQSKKEKADELGVAMISESEFLKIIGK
jgi:DNA ligase (NAD+)